MTRGPLATPAPAALCYVAFKVLRFLVGLPDLGPWRLAGALVVLLDLFAIGRAVSRRQGVEATLAWIFAILALPGAGAIAYLLLANPRLPRRSRRMQRAREAARAAGRIVHRVDLEEGAGPGDFSVLRLAAATTGFAPRAGNRVELLTRDEAAVDRMWRAFLEARRSIWAEYYIIANDDTGALFLDLLADRARAGLEVRLIYDAVGSWGIDRRRLEAIRTAGGHAAEFLPMNPVRRRWSVHLRNHRKLVVVDGEVAFTGGMNVGDEYSGLGRRRGRDTFRDSHLELGGPVVGDLARLFAEDWEFATGEPLPVRARPPAEAGADSVVSVLPSGPDQTRNASGLAFFAGIATARQRIWLTSAYFVPETPTVQALVASALRGVDVRVLVPRVLDVPLLGAAARSYYPALLEAGVRIWEYLPRMLHAKTLVVDSSWGVVGSANVDVRSSQLNFELGALVVDAAFARRLEQAFEADLAESEEIHVARVRALPRLARLRDGAARLLAPLL